MTHETSRAPVSGLIPRLTEISFSRMLSEFQNYNHKPSDEMLAALYELIDTLTGMAAGTAQPLYHLCSVDPGVGKSTAIIQWLKTYLEDPIVYGDSGILISLDRHEEIERFVNDSKVDNDDFAVYVSDWKEAQKLNTMGLGKHRATSARVLFTTKAQIKLRTRGTPFKDAEMFYYQGKPRQVRIWDESLSIGKPLTLGRLDIAGILSVLDKRNGELREQVEDVFNDLKRMEDNSIYEMPEFDLSLNEVLHTFSRSTADRRATAETLWLMSGKAVTVRRDNQGEVMVDCIEDMPVDFPPCLVTDASARVRETYHLQELYRKDVKRLQSAQKRYDKLTFKVWRKASGKGVYHTKEIYRIADEATKVINSMPEEKFLVIHHKTTDDSNDLKRLIIREVNGNPERVKFIHYGRHTSTNDYSEIPNVIVAGTLFYRVADYEALGRASASRPTSDGPFTKEEIERVKRGESAHHLLQAICRGKVRKCEGDECPPSAVWLITSAKTGIEELLPTVFPGSKKELWKVSDLQLKGKLKAALEYLKVQLDEGKTRILVKSVRDHIGVKHSFKFKRDVLWKEEFKQKLEELHLIVDGSGRGSAFIRPDFSYYFGVSPAE